MPNDPLQGLIDQHTQTSQPQAPSDPMESLIQSHTSTEAPAVVAPQQSLMQKAMNMSQTIAANARQSFVQDLKSVGEGAVDAFTAAKDTVLNMSTGLVKGVGQLIGSDTLTQGATRLNQQQNAELNQAIARSPIGARIGEGVGMAAKIVPQVMMGGTTAVGQALAGAGMEALTSNADSLGRRALDAGLMGVSQGLIAKAMPAVVNAVRGVPSMLGNQAAVAEDVAQQIPDALVGKSAANAAIAEKYGVPITPGEASGSAALQAGEGRLPLTPEGQKAAEDVITGRSAILKGNLQQVVHNVVSEGGDVATATRQALYAKASATPVDADAIASLRSNPAIAAGERAAVGDQYSPIQGTSPNTVGYWDSVKKTLDNKMATDLTSGAKPNPAIAEGLDTLKSTLDAASPEYATARSIAQRQILQGQLQKKLSSIPLLPGQDTPTLNQMYKSLAGTQEQRAALFNAVDVGGGNVGQTQELLNLINTVRNSPITKLLTKSTDTKAQNMGGDLAVRNWENIKNFVNGKYNQALLDVSLNPSKYGVFTKAAEGIKDAGSDAGKFASVLSNIIPKELIPLKIAQTGIGLVGAAKGLVSKVTSSSSEGEE